MQWSADNTPSTIQCKSLKLRELFAKTANAALARGFSKEESIFAGTNAVKIEERKNQPAKVKAPKLPSHVEALRSYNNPFEVVSKAEEIPTISNSITSADFDSEGHLILSMSDGKKIKTKNKAVEQNIEQNIAIAPNVQLFSSDDSVSITQDGQVFDLSASTSGSVNLTSSDGSIVISGTDGSYDLAVSAASPASTLVVQVRNQTGSTLTKGTAVYISGASGNKPLVSKALATSDATSAQTLGLITADITTNQNGYVTIIGVVSGLNTSAFSEGVQLYLSSTVAGTYTATKPHAPNHLVYVGVVTRSHQNQGTIEVKVQNGYELDEIHDVQIVNPTNGQIIAYDSSTQLWKNVNAPSSFLPLTGGTMTGSISFSESQTWPTFNQNTTGTSSNVTGIVSILNGGTNATTSAEALTNLGGTTVGKNLFTLSNPSAVTFPRFNADNTVSALSQTDFQLAIGASATATANSLVLRDSAGSFLATNGGFSGQVAVTRAWDAATGKGQILLTGLTGNRIDWIPLGLGAPTTTTRSAGTKLTLSPGVSATNVDYGIGLETNALWHSVPSTTQSFKWYAGTTAIASLSSTALTAPAFVKSGGSAFEFLKADGSVDTTTYLPTSGGTMSGAITFAPSQTWPTWSLAQGGTGATSAASARTNLGLGSAAVLTAGAANGVATLDSDGTVPLSQIPSALQGALQYIGTWNASTNNPTLTSSVGTQGYYYVVNVAGSTNLDGITDWKVGDWAIFNGAFWQKIDNTDAVTSVNGSTGAVVLTTTNVSEGSNFYYTDARARTAISSTATGLTYTSGTGVFSLTSGYGIPTTASQTNWDTAYNQTRQWDGGSTGLVAATGRTSLGLVIGTDVQAYDADLAAIAGLTPTLDNFIVGTGSTWTTETPAQARGSLGGTTVGQNLFTLTNPSAVTFPRINLDNTVSTLNAADFRTAIGAGTVTSVSGAGTVSGLTLSGTVTASGSLTLGGTLAVTPGNFAAQTANTVLAGPTTGVAATPSFRALVAADIPSLNYVTAVTGTAPVTSSGGLTPAISLASGYGDTQNPYASKTANFVLAAPNGAAGAPTFRALVAADIPTLNQNTTGTAANVTGTVAIANGGTGSTTASGARTNLGAVGGSGTTNRLAKFTAASTLGDSVFGDDGGSAYLYGSSAANIRFLPGATTPTFAAWIRAYTNGGLGIDAGASTDFNYYGTGPVNFWRGTQLGGPGVPVTNIPILQIKNDGNCEFRGPWRSATGGAQIYLNDATGNRIDFNAAGQGFPTTTTRSVGTKIVLSPNLTSTLTDYAIGVVAAGGIFGIWQSVPADNANFYWYAGTNRIATLSGKGYFSANTFQSNGEWSDTSGQLYLNGTTGNRIDFNNNGVAPPSFTTRSVGAKIVLHPAIASNSADYALGIESSRLWFGVPTTTNSFRWYAGTNVVATLLGSGQFSAPNIDASQNLSYNGTLYASGPAEFGGFNYGNGRINMLPSTSGSTKFLDFWSTNQGQQVGSISTNGVNTFYNNLSDYRMKENIAPVENASDKVLRLKPCSFNYIGHDLRVDGFIAHEIQEVADYVVTGEKDAVHEDGSINAQQIDPSKLVPLLTAALQDALKRIENLEKIIANQQGEEHVQ